MIPHILFLILRLLAENILNVKVKRKYSCVLSGMFYYFKGVYFFIEDKNED